MYPPGHIGVSLALYSPFLAALSFSGNGTMGFLGMMTIVLTCTLPDIDTKPPFNKGPFSSLVPHRGPTHTVWFGILIGLITASIFALIPPSLVGMSPLLIFLFGFYFGFFGIFSHLVGDMLNHAGVRPLWPIGPKYSFHITSAKGVWWFFDIKSGNQEEMTFWERTRHSITDSNKIFFIIGLCLSGAASLPYLQTLV